VQRPEFFLDRSLGWFAVASRLRVGGWELVTLAEHYGMDASEQVTDSQWIRDAAGRGWPILMKDERIRYRSAEIDLFIQHQAQCFVITSGDLTPGQMAERFLANQRAIFAAATLPGPSIHVVRSDCLDRLLSNGQDL
jgi:hypothetical protein